MTTAMLGWYAAALDRSVPWPDDVGEPGGKPRRVTAAFLLRCVPGVREMLGRVPAEYTGDTLEGQVVACPCGRRPVLSLGELRTCCRARAWVPTRAGCDRAYLIGRDTVFVLNSPKAAA